jgi:hypothetical protein
MQGEGEVKDLLETLLLVLMSAVTSNSHGEVDLHGTSRKRVARTILGRLHPILKLSGVEDNDSFVLVLLEEFILLWLALLLAGRSFPLSLDATGADLDLRAIQGSFFVARATICRFSGRKLATSSCKGSLHFGWVLHGTSAHDAYVKLQDFVWALDLGFCEEFGLRDSVTRETKLLHPNWHRK